MDVISAPITSTPGSPVFTAPVSKGPASAYVPVNSGLPPTGGSGGAPPPAQNSNTFVTPAGALTTLPGTTAPAVVSPGVTPGSIPLLTAPGSSWFDQQTIIPGWGNGTLTLIAAGSALGLFLLIKAL